MENPMMAPQDAGSLPKATTVTDGGMSGLKTAFGSALFDATTGEFVLRDADGNNLTYAAKYGVERGRCHCHRAGWSRTERHWWSDSVGCRYFAPDSGGEMSWRRR